MPHYANIGIDPIPQRQVCQYCGRPLKQNASINQGCGSVCRMKHRRCRYRVITSQEVPSSERFSELSRTE